MLQVYEAIEDDAALARLPEMVAVACGARSANIVYLSAPKERPFQQISYFPEAWVHRYVEHFLNKDPWRIEAKKLGVQGRAVAMDELVPPSQFVLTEIHNELFRPMGDDTGRCMGIDARIGSAALHIAVHRPLLGPAFSLAEKKRLEEVFLHVAQVLRVRSILDQEGEARRRVEQMVVISGVSMLTVDCSLRILASSGAAIALLDRNDGLSCRDGRLCLASSSLNIALRETVSRAIRRASDGRTGLLCHRPSGLPAYRLLVAPAGAQSSDGAVIIVDDPASLSRGEKSGCLAEAYGLTPAENIIAQRLLEGLTLEEIAASRGVSVETIRSQLKSIFAKTNTRRQAELVSLLS